MTVLSPVKKLFGKTLARYIVEADGRVIGEFQTRAEARAFIRKEREIDRLWRQLRPYRITVA